MKIWTVANQKGGVGKTTTSVTLAGLLASEGKRVLLVDMDSQGSLTSYFKLNPDEQEISIYNLFQDAAERKKDLSLKPYIMETAFSGIYLAPASTALATLDRQAASIPGMGLVMSSGLGKVSSYFDYVVLDTPPMLGVLMINALASCEKIIIPAATEYLTLKGLERLFRTLNMVFRSRNSPPSYHIIPTIFDKRTRAALQCLKVLQEQYGEYLSSAIVPIDTKLREASNAGVPASMFTQQSRAVNAYQMLLNELLDLPSAEFKQAAVG